MTDTSHFSDPLDLDRYFAGELSPDEYRAFEKSLAQQPDEQAMIGAMRTGLSEPKGAVPSYDYEARVAAVLDYSARYTRRARRQSPARRSSPKMGQMTVIAGGCVLAVVVGGAGWKFFDAAPVNDTALERRMYQTANAQRATVTLADGSTVHLGPATTLVATPGFGESERHVAITGEAYFSVTASAQQPFLVEAGHSVVRVLGTAFNVRKYDTDSAAQVAVAEGRVLLRAQHLDDAGEAILPPASLGTISPSGQILVTSQISLDDYLGWRTGRLSFRDVPLSSVAADLGRAYDVEIRIADSALAAQLVTLTVSTQREPVSQILNGLMLPLDAHYRRQGRMITIAPGTGAASRITPSTITPITSEIRYGK